MTDYSKLKVTELKEELKNRGTSITGLKLKQQFIDKLLEIDAFSAADHVEPTAAEDAPPEGSPRHSEQTQQPTQEENEVAEAPETLAQSISETHSLAQEPSDERSSPLQTRRSEPSSEPHFPEAPQQSTGTNKSPPSQSSSPKDTGKTNESAIPSVSSQTPSTSVLPSSDKTTPSVTQTEIRDDSKKRKRRSLTPPPAAKDVVQKKARMSGDDSTLTEESKTIEVPNGNTLEVSLADSAPIATQNLVEKTTSEQISVGAEPRSPKVELRHEYKQGDEHLPPDGIEENGTATSAEDYEVKTLLKKNSGGDARFKGLVRADLGEESPTLEHNVEEDRPITLALHPPTSSLYIRNLKRPLQLPALKAHLISLATPSQSSPQTEMVKQFYLDAIKTHAFVSFVSTSAASRVRSVLHDTRWPEEKSREPLWVDFIPDEKVEEWIEKERTSGGSMTRWEIVYEDSGDSVHAILQEVGTYRKPPSQMPKAAETPDHGDGIPPDRAPLVHPDRAAFVSRNGPRQSARIPTESAPPTGDSGFKALDDLFPSTMAKPKLYFKPVSKRLAANRRERFRDLLQVPEMRGRGADQETRRYSFEEGDYWVDKGPEFGYGHRGGYRGRGRGNSYLGRGSRMDDSWRGRGH